jgi:hypothetical protein
MIQENEHNIKSCLCFKAHQESFRSYEEVCEPALERCQFLLHVLRPAVSGELAALSKLKLLNMIPRWKRLVSQVIQENRKLKEGEKGSAQGRESQETEREEDLSVERVALRLAVLEESKQEQEVRQIFQTFLISGNDV